MTLFTNTVNKHAELIQLLSDFVSEVCKERDISHGWSHMKLVADLGMVISTEYNLSDEEVALMLICAWLHDVNDHKYGNENKVQLDNFLTTNFSANKDKIIAIIDRVSFSREKKYGRTDWLEVMGEDGQKIRNIVSDADKIDAINLKRCREYEEMRNPTLSDKELWIRVIYHCNEKLIHLKDDYLVTQTAKTMAEPLHEILISQIKSIKTTYNI